MQETQFGILAEQMISSIAEQIEEQDLRAVIEVDLLGDILSLTTPVGQYIINKQTAAKELWLVSPISGPYHFLYLKDKWQTRQGIEILALLNSELSRFVSLSLEY